MHKLLKTLHLSLINAGYANLDEQWDYDNVISPFSRLYYIESGYAKVYHNNETFELTPGNLYLIPSFTYSRYKCDDRLNQYYLSFFEDMANGISVYHQKSFIYQTKANDHDIASFKRLLQINPNRALMDDNPAVYDNYSTLQSYEKKNDQMSSSQYLETMGLLLGLFSRFILDTHPLSKNDTLTSQKISETIHYINEHLREELTLELLAERCHMNVDYYSRSFKNLLGVRPIRYIQSRRIERAQLLLSTTSYSIPEIANKIGLTNLSYFSRLFKKLTNKTPGEFRKQQWSI